MSKPKPDEALTGEPDPSIDPAVLGCPHVVSYPEFLAVSRAALTQTGPLSVEERVEFDMERATLEAVILNCAPEVSAIYGALVLTCWRGWLAGRFPRLRAIAAYLDPYPRDEQ